MEEEIRIAQDFLRLKLREGFTRLDDFRFNPVFSSFNDGQFGQLCTETKNEFTALQLNDFQIMRTILNTSIYDESLSFQDLVQGLNNPNVLRDYLRGSHASAAVYQTNLQDSNAVLNNYFPDNYQINSEYDTHKAKCKAEIEDSIPNITDLPQFSKDLLVFDVITIAFDSKTRLGFDKAYNEATQCAVTAKQLMDKAITVNEFSAWAGDVNTILTQITALSVKYPLFAPKFNAFATGLQGKNFEHQVGFLLDEKITNANFEDWKQRVKAFEVKVTNHQKGFYLSNIQVKLDKIKEKIKDFENKIETKEDAERKLAAFITQYEGDICPNTPADIKQGIADYRAKYEPINTVAIGFGVDVQPYKTRFETVENKWLSKASAVQRKKMFAYGAAALFVIGIAASGFIFKDKISAFIDDQAECSESAACAGYWKDINDAFASYKINKGKEQKEDRNTCITFIQSMAEEECNCHTDSIKNIKKQINYE